MKRIYLKPEIRILKLRLNTFLTAGSGPQKDPVYGWGKDEGGDNTGSGGIETGGPGDLSRSWGRKMWEDME